MTLFAITNYHWPIYWIICFILFGRLSFSYWLWRRVIPHAQFRLRAQHGCDRSAEDAYSSMAPDVSFAFLGGLCCPALDFVFAFWTLITLYTLLTLQFCIDLKNKAVWFQHVLWAVQWKPTESMHFPYTPQKVQRTPMCKEELCGNN
jgi:hypothetical protein